MNWTDKKPEVEGHYWLSGGYTRYEPQVVYWYGDGYTCHGSDADGSAEEGDLWFGPLSHPSLPADAHAGAVRYQSAVNPLCNIYDRDYAVSETVRQAKFMVTRDWDGRRHTQPMNAHGFFGYVYGGPAGGWVKTTVLRYNPETGCVEESPV